MTHHFGNDSSSFHPAHSLIRAVGPPDLHHVEGRGLKQHAKPAHQFPIFLASQGCQFLLQSAPIETAAVVIPQGGALLLHPAVEITLIP